MPSSRYPTRREHRPVNSPEAGRNGDQGAEQAKPDWVARSLEALTSDQREVLRLRVVVGLSTEETAIVLGHTPTLVRVLQHRALNELRRVLDLSPESGDRSGGFSFRQGWDRS